MAIGRDKNILSKSVLAEMIVLHKYLRKDVMDVFQDGRSTLSNLLIITGTANALGLILAEGGI